MAISGRRVFLSLLLICVMDLYAYPENLADLVQPAQYRELSETGSLKLIQLKDPVIGALPENQNLKRHIYQYYKEMDPSMLIECYYAYKKMDGSSGRWTSEERTGLYNRIRAISSLAGIQYYSASRKTMRTFYSKSSIIDSFESQVPQIDPVFDHPPEKAIVHAKQEDLTFGENVYLYEYTAYDEMLLFTQTNLTNMKYGIFPLLGKRKLFSVVAVMDADDYLLVYSATMVKAASLPVLEGKMRDSFSNRADAVYGWFSANADRVFKR